MKKLNLKEDFALESSKEYLEPEEVQHPAIIKLDGKHYATMGVSKAVTFNELKSIMNKYIESNSIFDCSIYVREVNTDKKIRSFILGESWYHNTDDFDNDLVLYKSLFDDTAVLGKEESEFLLEYSL